MILRNKVGIKEVVVYFKSKVIVRPGPFTPHMTSYPAYYRLGLNWFQLAPNELSRWSE
jgi:hypothetical protein